MSKPTESVRIEVKTKPRPHPPARPGGGPPRPPPGNMEKVSDEKVEDFMDNVKWTRKHATTLNEKFSLTTEA